MCEQAASTNTRHISSSVVRPAPGLCLSTRANGDTCSPQLRYIHVASVNTKYIHLTIHCYINKNLEGRHTYD